MTTNVKTIKSRYLFIIANNVSDEIEEKFSGYLVMLSREGDEKSENDFIDLEMANVKAAMKVTFGESGEIYESNFLLGINEVYRKELNDTLLSLIPRVSNADESEDDFNNTIYAQKINGHVAIGEDALRNSKYTSNIVAKTEFRKISASNMKSELKVLNGEYENEETNIGNEFKDISTINSFFSSISVVSEQNITNIDSQNETKEYEEKLNKYSFSGISLKNGMRILSEEEYNEEMKLQNDIEKKYENYKRNLAKVGDITSSLEFSSTFKYEIFKTNILGIEFALRVSVDWVPNSQTITYKLFFQRGKREFNLDPQYISIENYSNVVKSYKTLLTTLHSEFDNKFLVDFSAYQNLSKNIKDNLTESIQVINNVTNELKNLYENFSYDLNNFKNNVTFYKFNFSNLNNSINYFNNYLNGIITQIEQTNQANLNYILNENFVNLTSQTYSNSFFNTFETFINKANNYYYNFPIDFYFKTKEIFEKIDNLIENYENKMNYLIDDKYLQIENYLNEEIYFKNMNYYINEIENITDIFRNNKILNASSDFLNRLESINKNYKNLKEKFLSKIKNNNGINYKNNISYFINKNSQLKTKKDNLINKMKNQSVSNYENYNKDIIKLNNLENEIFEKKLEFFQTEIVNKLNEIKPEEFLSDYDLRFNSIKIDNEINSIVKNLNEKKEIDSNFKNIITIFDNLINKKDEFKKNIEYRFEFYFLNKYLQNFYSNYNNILNTKYTNFFNEIINNSIYNNLSSPQEIIYKFKNRNVTENVENFNDKINFVVRNKIKNLLYAIIYKIYNFVQNESNKIKININNLNTNVTIATVNKYYNQINEKLNNFEKEIPDLMFKVFYLKNEIKVSIEQKEKDINSMFISFADDLAKKFTNSNKVANFQISKMRNLLSTSNTFQSFIDNIITDENLNFSSENFKNLFGNSENFNENSITAKIQELLFSLNKDNIKKIETYLNNITNAIKEGFPKSYELIDKIYTSIFKAFYEIPKNLEEQFDLLFLDAKALARKGMLNDCNHLKNTKFFFDSASTDLEKIFNDIINGYIEQLKEKQKQILDDLKLSYSFTENIFNQIKGKLYDDFENYRNELLINMTAQTPNNCILLNNIISYTSIVNSTINEEINKFNDEKKENFIKKLEDPFNEYKQLFNTYFKKFNKDFEYQYRFFFDTYRNVLTKYSSSSKNSNEIKDLTNIIREGFEEGLNLSLNKFGSILNTESFSKAIDTNMNITKILVNVFHDITPNMTNVNENIKNDINNLKNKCDEIYINEKDQFNNEIFNYIQIGFNESVKRFLNGNGKSYLDNIFNNNYEFLIAQKLDFVEKKNFEINNYLKYIINQSSSKNFYFKNSIDDVYYKIMNDLNEGINQKKINEIIYKINEFKRDSAEKIVEYFNNNLPKNASFLNEYLIQILPKKIPVEIQIKLKEFYYEMFDEFYLKEKINLYEKTTTNNLINNLNNYRNETLNLIGSVSESSSTIAVNEFNNLNSSYYQMINNFAYYLSDSIKKNISNIFENNQIKNYFEDIIKKYKENYNNISINIENNVNINLNLNNFTTFINDWNNKINTESNYDEKVKELFKSAFNISLEQLKNNVFDSYKQQTGSGTGILNISVNRRLEETNNNETEGKNDTKDFEIEELQVLLNLLEIKILTFNQNKTIKETIVQLRNELNPIEKNIQKYLFNFDNYLEKNLNDVQFYLKNSYKISYYRQNFTNTKKNINVKLTELFKKEIDKINKILISINNFKFIYNDDIKPLIINKMYNITKEFSSNIIENYLKAKANQNETDCKKLLNLNNLGVIDSFLGSSKLTYSTIVDCTILKWSYNFTPDPNNSQVFLNVSAGGSAKTTISFLFENFNSTIKGNLGEGSIGMYITNDFQKSKVLANYYTRYNDTLFFKELFNVTVLEPLDSCDNKNSCYEFNNKFCPYVLDKNNNEIINIDKNKNKNYYKNTNIYDFIQTDENDLCKYANYIYGVEEVQFSFNSSLNRTL